MAHENGEPAVLSASTIIGNGVVNTEGDDLGEIKELMIDLSFGKVAYAVLQYGGFLGIGDKLFAIPWEALSLNTENKKFMLGIDEETLKNAEGFDKDNWPDMADYKWSSTVYDYYGYPKYWE
jgi:sporulation protein YlmC with PRC-barrel domain